MTEPPPSPAATTGSSSPGQGISPVQELAASVVVFLVALPLCMGIAIASGVPVAYGLITGIVGGLVVGLIAGSPLQVSGPAAGLAVLIYDLVTKMGLEVLGITVLIAGLIQVIAGLLKLGQWFRAVSPAVIEGMLAGIGVLIFASQFHVMVDDAPKATGLQNLLTIPEAIRKGLPWPELAARDQRKVIVEANHAVGTLHHDQVALAEGYRSHFDGEAVDATYDPTNALKIQQQHQARLDEIGERLLQGGTFDSDPGQPRKTAFQDANAAIDEAIVALQAGEPAAEQLQLAADKLFEFEKTLKNHRVAAKIGLLTIGLIIGWQLLAKVPGLSKLRVIPAPLVAIVIVTCLAWFLQATVMYVEVPANLLADTHRPTWTTIRTLDWAATLTQAAIIAIVASAETLLCAAAVDQMHSGARTKYDRELFAQGIGNTICGFLGSLPMTGVIVRSAANVQAGGQTRASAILHGLWLLMFCAVLSSVLEKIPVASLAAILVFTGVKLMGFGKAIRLWRSRRGEAIIFFIVVATIVWKGLLVGVVVGIVLASIKTAVTFSRLNIETSTDLDGKQVLSLDGSATFFSLPKLAAALEEVAPGTAVELNMDRMQFIDHSCVELLGSWERQHEASGGSLTIDWPHVQRASDQPLSFASAQSAEALAELPQAILGEASTTDDRTAS